MSNIKKGAKLTVSTGNGISRHTTQNLGILEVSGPAMSDTTTDYTSNNTAQLTIGATDVSGVLKLGINNDGNTFIDAIKHNNHTDIIMQKYGGDVIIGSGAGSTAKVGIRTNAPNSTFHINSTDGLIIPVGTNGERPDPAYNGMIRYNTTTSQFEGYGPGSAWGSLGGVKDVDGDTYILAESSANADNDDLQFFTAGQERMSINSVGDVSMNGDITTDTGYPYYQSLGTENIVNPPSTALTVHGVNITAMNKRTRASYASAEACVGTWTARSSATEGNSWCSVCWSPELSIFVAVAYAGTNRVMTSPDGITWTARSSASEANDWNSVCWSPELSIFVAVAYGGTNRVMTSPDGITWTARSSASEANTWVSVCWSPELSIFVAVANSGTNRVMTSPDGITWTARSSASEANGWISVCWSPELSIFVAVAYSGTNRVMTSPDGITWTARSSATEANSWQSVCWSPELSIFVAVAVGGTNRVMTSPDGITWTARSSASDANGWRAVCWSPELSIFVAVAYNGTNRVMTSPDGITWTARSSATEANSWYSVCWSPELSIFVAVVPGGTNQVMTSNIGMPNSKSVVKALPTQMSVLPNGNVGIGTFAEEKLVVDGNMRLLGDLNVGLVDADATHAGTLSAGYDFGSQTKILASDAAGNDQFGISVAISGNYAIVGARYSDDGSIDSGSAYIFNVSTGTELHKLVASDAAAGDSFGSSVAISGNYAIVGANGDDDGGSASGSAYIFNVSTGTQLHKLVASDAAAVDFFGYSVAISGNYAIVGAYGDDGVPNDSGSAYIFNVSTGTQLHKLVANDAAASDNFGYSVAISGNYAIVGAQYNDDGGANSGSAYIFNVSTGTQLHKLLASDAAAVDNFGYSVAISGNYAIVGAPYNDDGGNDSGSAYIFAPSFHVTESGNVGIGTTSPQTKLHVETTITANDTTVPMDSDALNNTVGLYLSNRYSPSFNFGVILGTLVNATGYIQSISNDGNGRNLVLNPGGGNVGIGTTSPDRGLCILDNQNTGQAIGNYYIGYNTSYQEPGALKIFQHLPIPVGTYRISDGGGNLDPAINIITNFIGSGANSGTHQGGCIQWSNQSKDNPTSGGHGQPYAAIYGGRHSSFANYEGEMIFYTSDTTNRASGRNLNPRMTIKGGNVGIGTPTPGAKLHVNGTVKTANLLGDTGITYSCSGYGKHYFTGTSHWAGNTSASAGSYGDYDAWNYYGTHDFIYLAKFTGAIVSTSGFIHLSDRRIKRDIVDVPDNESLNKVLQIEVRKYGYKDYINKGTYKVTGFIAQEVLAVFPEAVSTKNDGVLPNIYKISTGFEYDNSNNKLTLNVTEIEVTEDIKIDCKLQLKFINHETLFEEYIEVLLKEINETNIVVEGVENIKEKIEKTQEIFIYGSHIDNLHTLNKDKIFTIHHGAIQELHKIIVAEKEKVATLESELAAIKQHLGI